ncbi:MAG: hypothetical protein K2O91_26195 [Lachnospiraceae bacterium]|nr:hypothetical protein [Lachnospiraceae bacterium]
MDVIEEKYLFGYAEQCYDKCSKCWLGRLCDICYTHCFDDAGLNMERKNIICHERMQSYKKVLVMYFELLEKDPHMFDFLVNDALI